MSSYLCHYIYSFLKCILPLQSELDGTVGRIMAALKQARVDKNTFVFFTSDNGLAKGSGM